MEHKILTEVTLVKTKSTPVPSSPADIADAVREIIFSGSSEDIRVLSQGLKKGDLSLFVNAGLGTLEEASHWADARS